MTNVVVYEDRCSRCEQPVTRLRLAEALKTQVRTVIFSKGRFVTSCCGVAPFAIACTPELIEQPWGECDVCHRKAFTEEELGTTCFMVQPNGLRCLGVFV